MITVIMAGGFPSERPTTRVGTRVAPPGESPAIIDGVSDDYVHWQDVTTRWNDNDVYGHLNNVVHHALMDTVVNTWLIDNAGLDLIHGTMIGLVVEVHCEYKEQAGFPDTISVGLRVGELGSTSVRFEIAMRRGDGETFFEGHFVHAFIDRNTRETLPIEGDFKAALQGLQVTS